MRSTIRHFVIAVALAGAVLPASAPNALAQHGPAPASTHLSSELLSLACAPTVVSEAPAVPLRVTGGQDVTKRQSFAQGDLITINAGTRNGMTVGQEFYVRRPLTDRRAKISTAAPATIRTAGWLRVYAVDDEMSLATIVYGCDTVNVGDYLEPFVMPTPVAAAEARPKPERDNYGRVMMGQDRRFSFGKGDYLVVDRGKDHGIFPGAHLVFYHDKGETGNFLYEAGEAVAVDVRENTATLLVTLSRDAIAVNDYVSLRRPPAQ
jgi:hypothetical protein